ncbi:hypothetical protein [uncultured Trichococcus sp.]|uniref:hypothetical protein n=1 Tax=uncultured Trichococcus sp. TaxID=189665 RepID=UPI0029C820BE|nr:hypothetical protein [uncultured Trichococcus sp.]
MKKSYIVMSVLSLLVVGIISRAFILNEGIKVFLLIFFLVGSGLGLLRIFVNNSIKKMKGKSLKTKILFFAVLLGIGLPIQSVFRTKVLYTMNPEYLKGNIFMLVSGMIIMTIFFGFVKNKLSGNEKTSKDKTDLEAV